MKTHRNHANYWAFVLHRISGLALLLFLPAHFYVLALAVEQAATLDMFLSWTEAPLVKFLETGLVVLLAAHMTGGLRILAIEFLAWPSSRGRRALATPWCRRRSGCTSCRRSRQHP